MKGHFVEVGSGMLNQEDPGLLEDRVGEEAAETLDGFDELLMFELGRTESLGVDSDSNGLVVRWERDDEAVKGVAIFGPVLGVVVQKAQEAIVDRLEEVGEDLGDVFDVVVSGGARDGQEVRCGVSEEGFCILRRSHGVLG